MGQRGFQRNLDALLAQILKNQKKQAKGGKAPKEIKKEESTADVNDEHEEGKAQ